MKHFEWIQWLRGEDAQTLLWHLCQWIEDPAMTQESLRARVRGWQRNATKAAASQSWTVPVDAAIGGHLNEWLWRWWQRRQEWGSTSE